MKGSKGCVALKGEGLLRVTGLLLGVHMGARVYNVY